MKTSRCSAGRWTLGIDERGARVTTAAGARKIAGGRRQDPLPNLASFTGHGITARLPATGAVVRGDRDFGSCEVSVVTRTQVSPVSSGGNSSVIVSR